MRDYGKKMFPEKNPDKVLTAYVRELHKRNVHGELDIASALLKKIFNEDDLRKMLEYYGVKKRDP